MPDQITNYQCPACGGPLHFSDESQDLACDYCDSHFTVADIEAFYAAKDEAAAAAETEENNVWEMDSESEWGEQGEQMHAYNCPSCGAELICDETTAASSCPYCGNPTIVPGQLQGTLRPDYVIPFRLDKEAAKAALRAHYKGKKLLPKSFTSENHIDEVKGIYVPFWLFDGEAEADLFYNATRSYATETRNERIITTEHFNLRRVGAVRFSKIPVDASSKMPDAHMDAIEPFDFSEMKPFSSAYLPGFYADKYDVSVEESAERADARAEKTAKDIMYQSCSGYETVREVGGEVRLHRGKVHYALLPVWVLGTSWRGQSFLFAMNGQTGKIVGDLPSDKGRWWAYFAGTLAVVAAGVTALLTLL